MKPQAYTTLAENEKEGWYYRARIRMVSTLVERFIQPQRPDLNILDVGCGTGGTSMALTRFGNVLGVEPSDLALKLLKKNYPELRVVQGDTQRLPHLVPRASFDLATIMGVLVSRAVPDPLAALKNVATAVKPGGWIIWNEATYPLLTRQHDDFVDVERRFYPSQMRKYLEESGFEVRHASHVLGWGFAPALALALVYRLKRWLFRIEDPSEEADTSDDRPLPDFLNRLLGGLTYLEWSASLKGIKAPLGVAYLAIAQKKTIAEPAADRKAA